MRVGGCSWRPIAARTFLLPVARNHGGTSGLDRFWGFWRRRFCIGAGMHFSLDVGSLRLAYRRHEVSPVSLIREVTARIAARGDDAVWISRVPDDVLLAEAAALERRADRDELPLYGIPLAVKDSIDAAGLPTTAG